MNRPTPTTAPSAPTSSHAAFPASSDPATSPVHDAGDALSLDRSVAGEEDPGASLDAPTHVPPPAPGSAQAGTAPAAPAPPPAPASSVASSDALAPGDEAPAGTPGTGETLCRVCGGSGKAGDGSACAECAGRGRVTVGVGGG